MVGDNNLLMNGRPEGFALLRDVNPNMMINMRPANVGPVGATVVRTRIRQSSPDMAWTYDPYWTPERTEKLGSNVQNGDTASHDSHGGPAKLHYANWPGNNSFVHQYGITYHNVQHPDLFVEPRLSSLGDFSWRRKVASVKLAKMSGRFWAPKPNGYKPNGPTRGGSYPQAEGLGGDQGPAGGGVQTESQVDKNANAEDRQNRLMSSTRNEGDAQQRNAAAATTHRPIGNAAEEKMARGRQVALRKMR